MHRLTLLQETEDKTSWKGPAIWILLHLLPGGYREHHADNGQALSSSLLVRMIRNTKAAFLDGLPKISDIHLAL